MRSLHSRTTDTTHTTHTPSTASAADLTPTTGGTDSPDADRRPGTDQRPHPVSHTRTRTRTRRAVLGGSLAVAAGGLLAACSDAGSGGMTGMDHGTMDPGTMDHDGAGHGTGTGTPTAPAGYVRPDGPEVAAAEAARPGGGRVREVRLTATPTPLDLGAGTTVRSWAYGDRLPGREVRVTAGDTLALTLANHLPQPTSLHWHGLALRNDMDGVPGLTQADVRPGAEFTYRFKVPHPGTYWFHPHSGVQQDRGLYAPLVVEDPKEPLRYDKEWVVVLDDWLDGVAGSTPDAVLAELRKGMSGAAHSGHSAHSGHDMSAMGDTGTTGTTGTTNGPSGTSTTKGTATPSRVLMGARSDALGGDAGDVAYPHYLVNGRVPADPETFRARPGDRIRLRIVNAGGDTAFRLALGGHELTVTHTDGFPVRPATTDSLLIGMGERYDVLVTARDGVFPLTAVAEGKGGAALAVLRTGAGAAPAAAVRPAELGRRLLTATALRAAPSAALPDPGRAPDRTLRIRLTGGMARYDWAFDGAPYRTDRRRPVRAGERVRLVLTNGTAMWHPLHLHGHTFALAGTTGGGPGPRKDTAVVLPGRTLTADFDADNPGLWMLHCHNVYHSEAGMMTVLGYQK